MVPNACSPSNSEIDVGNNIQLKMKNQDDSDSFDDTAASDSDNEHSNKTTPFKKSTENKTQPEKNTKYRLETLPEHVKKK